MAFQQTRRACCSLAAVAGSAVDCASRSTTCYGGRHRPSASSHQVVGWGRTKGLTFPSILLRQASLALRQLAQVGFPISRETVFLKDLRCPSSSPPPPPGELRTDPVCSSASRTTPRFPSRWLWC